MQRPAGRFHLAAAGVRFGVAAVLILAIGVLAAWAEIDDSIPKPFNPAWSLLAAPLVALFGLAFAIASVYQPHSRRSAGIALALNFGVLAVFAVLMLP